MSRKKGFTLIEVLVVIVIIALLVAIIIPAVKAAKEIAQRMICLAHMRGVGSMVLVYTESHKNELPLIMDWSWIAQNYNATLPDLGLDYAADYYTYNHTFHPVSIQGPMGLGWLYKADLLDPETDLVFCPSQKELFGNQPPTRQWNAKAEPLQWNFCGRQAYNGTYNLAPKDDDMDWLNLRVTIGMRKLYHHGNNTPGNMSKGCKTIQEASLKGKRAFLCDLWAACLKFGDYWKSLDTDLPHKMRASKSMNCWYMDGHAENVRMEDNYFSIQTIGGKTGNYLDTNMTWSIMFD